MTQSPYSTQYIVRWVYLFLRLMILRASAIPVSMAPSKDPHLFCEVASPAKRILGANIINRFLPKLRDRLITVQF